MARLEGVLRGAGLILLAMTLVVSSWLSPGISRPFPGLTVALGGVLAVLAALCSLSSRRLGTARSIVGWATALLAWVWLTTLFSIEKHHSLQSASAMTGAVAVLLLLIATIASHTAWRLVAHAYVLNAVLLCIYGFLTNPDFPRAPLLATFSNADSFSIVPITANCLCYALLSRCSATARLLLWLESFILTLGVLATHSRAALVATAVAAICFCILISRRPVNLSKRKPRNNPGLVAMVPLFLALSLFAMAGFFASSQRFQVLSASGDQQGITMRRDVAVYSLLNSFRRPLTGSGPGTFALAYQQFRPPSALPAYMFVNVAHDDPVEVLIETGWPGLLLWILLVLFILKRGYRLVRRSTAAGLPAGAMAGVLGIAAFSLLNFVISLPCLLFTLFALLGLTVSNPGEDPDPLPLPHRALLVALLIPAGLWSLWFGLQVARSNHYLRLAEQRKSELLWEEAQSHLEHAIAADPGYDRLYLERARLKLMAASFEGEEDPSVGADLEKALALNPRNQDTLKDYSGYLRSHGELSKAEQVLRQARAFAPYQDWILNDLAAVELLQGNLEEAARISGEMALRDEKNQPALVAVLAGLEQEHPGQGVALVRAWLAVPKQQAMAVGTSEKLVRRWLPKQAALAAPFADLLNEINPKEVRYKFLQAECARGQGDNERARRIYTDILAGKPDRHSTSKASLQLAEMDIKEGQRKAAIERLKAALERDPGDTEVVLLLSEIYLEEEQMAPAKALLRDALRSDPHQAQILARLSRIFYEEDVHELARDYAREALREDPNNKEALKYLRLSQ